MIELKIWYGQQYIDDGEIQLAKYLDRFQLDEGYLLAFSFLVKKDVSEVFKRKVAGKKLTEVIVWSHEDEDRDIAE